MVYLWKRSILYTLVSKVYQRGLEIKIVKVKNVQSKAKPHGLDARNISDTENAQVAHITLKPGESLKKHITPVDVVFYVLEGKSVVEIGEERKKVGQILLSRAQQRFPIVGLMRARGSCEY